MRSVYPGGQGFLAAGPLGTLRISVAARTFTSLPSGDTEVSAADRHDVDLSKYGTAAIVVFVQTAGTTGVACLQYSLDNSAWADLTNTVSMASTGFKKSTPMSIPAAARTNVMVRLIGRSGNGVESPVLNSGVALELA